MGDPLFKKAQSRAEEAWGSFGRGEIHKSVRPQNFFLDLLTFVYLQGLVDGLQEEVDHQLNEERGHHE